MGGKLAGKTNNTALQIQQFVDSVAAEHRPIFDTLQSMITKMVPDAEITLKWGTLAYDVNGSLFALSVSKKCVNFYILTLGVIAKHKRELAGIPQGNCVLRFAPNTTIPTGLKKVMQAALAAKKR